MSLRLRSPEKHGRLPAGPRGLPILGNLLSFQRDALSLLLDAYRRHGDMATLRVPGPARVGVFGASLVHELLVAPEDVLGKTGLGGFVGLWLSQAIGGVGIISAAGEEHRRHRQVVLRAFGNQHLAGYQALLCESTDRALEAWRPGTEIDLVHEITRMGKRAAHRLLFGVDPTLADVEFGEALDEVAATLDASYLRFVTSSLLPWDVPGISRGGTARRQRAIIDRWLRAALREPNNRSLGRVLLDHGREIDPSWGEDQVRDNLIQLFMTGYDTTTCATVWTLYLLAQHPEACARLLAELHEVLGGRTPEAADVPRLPFLDAVVKESLRLYPTGPYGFRQALVDLELGGYDLPRGTVLVYSPWVTHRIPALFSEPEAFLPERFASGASYPRGAFIPFGQGARSCVAATLATLQIKTTVAILLQRFRLDLVSGQRIRAVSTNAIHLTPGLRVRLAVQDGDTSKSPAVVYGNVVGARSP